MIEQKLDGIMSLLDENRHLLQPSSNTLTPSEPVQSSRTNTVSSSLPISPAMTDMHPTNQPTPQAYTTLEAQQLREQAIEIIPGFKMSFEEADLLLQEYMSTMLPQFPFVPLETGSVVEMSREQPILLKAILFTCRPPSQSIRAEFEQWFRQYIAHQVVVLGAKRLELLQAIIIFLAWNDFRYYVDTRHTSLLQLAAGLVNDTGLSRNPDNQGLMFRSFIDDASILRNEFKRREQHTNNERRAVLGLFYVTSSISSLLNRAPCIGYTVYFEECCDALIRDHEYPTDALLAQLVRVQQMATKVNNSFLEAIDGVTRPSQRSFHALAILIMQKELDQWMDQLSPDLKTNQLIYSHYNAVLVRLYEPVVHVPASEWPGEGLSRAQRIWDYFQHARTLCNTFLSCPPENLSRSTFVLTAHLAMGMIKLIRLHCLEDPDWDTATASKTAKLMELQARLSNHFQAASCARGPKRVVMEERQDLLMSYAERLKMLQRWCLVNLPQHSTDPNPASVVTDPVLYNNLYQLGDFEFWQMLSESGYTYGIDEMASGLGPVG